MLSVGSFLKKSRLEKKIKLQTISNELNISYEVLNQLENNNFPNYISNVFLLGHIRSYAKFLELDEKRIIESYKSQILGDDTLVNEIQRPIKSVGIFSNLKILSIASFMVITFGFYFLFIDSITFQKKYAMIPDVPEIFLPVIEQAEIVNHLNSKKDEKKLSNSLITASNKDELFLEKNDNKNFSNANASLPKVDNSVNFDKIVTLKFINSTWIQLRDNNNGIILSKLMTKDDEYSYKTADKFNLTAGNAGNIVVLIDGKVRGKAGKLGQIIESLIITNNFNN